MKRIELWLFSMMLVVLFAAAPAVLGQTASFTKTAIDAIPPDAEHLEKTIGYFTSTAYPSYYLGTTSGGYIYDTTTGKRITVDQDGFHYERARTYLYPGDTYPGIIASVNGQLIWYQNPANSNGGDATQPWGKQVIIQSWCHDLRLADFDGDGKMDVACSGTNTQGDTQARIAFQNSPTSWTEINLYQNAGDSVAIFDYNGRPNVVGVSASTLSWYENPGGAAARNPASWVPHYIGPGTIGTSLITLNVGSREIVVQSSNEEETNNVGIWPTGLAYFDPGSNPYGSWTENVIDDTYRDVHELASDVLGGVPFFVAGEQSQASSACQPDRYNDHPSISGCRVSVFPWTGSGFGPPTLLSNLGTQNQAMLQVNGVEYVLGANHDAYNDYDIPLYRWTFTFAGMSAGSPLASGTYVFEDAAGNTLDAGWSHNQTVNQPYIFEYTYNANSDQQFAWNSGNGSLQIVPTGGYLVNSAETLGIGTSPGTFNIVPSGGGYTIQDPSTGLYVTSPGVLGPPNKIAFSSVSTVWTVVPVIFSGNPVAIGPDVALNAGSSPAGGTGGSSANNPPASGTGSGSTGSNPPVSGTGSGSSGSSLLASGTYIFEDPAGNTLDAGWSQNHGTANQPYIFEYFYNGTNPWQQFVWNSGNDSLQVVASGSYLFNSANTLGIGTTAGTFNIVSSGGGYTIQDTSTGLYLTSPGLLGPPNKLNLSSVPTVWTAVPATSSGSQLPILSENFDELPTSLNATNFGAFSVTSGTADVLGGALYGSLCAPPESGNCVDMDGSDGNPGAISTGNLTLLPGTYTLSFDLLGSERGVTTSTTVSLGSLYNNTFVLASDDDTSGIVSATFTVYSTTVARLTFTSNTPGSYGALLDNVKIQPNSILSENFDELPTSLNATNFGAFSVTSGTADVLGGALYGSLCAPPESGNCVDMDGSDGNPGAISTGNLTLLPGTYTLSFDLLGSERGVTTSTTVSLGSLYNNTFVLASDDDTSGIVSATFTVYSTTVARLTFTSNTPGSYGALLDNVKIQPNP